jgi:GT2 family glycosyltransferase
MNERLKKLNIYSQNNMARINQINADRKFYEYAHQKKKPGISIIILNLNKPELIIPLIDYLKQQQVKFKDLNLMLEIIIGDTGSSDPAVLSCLTQLSQTIDNVVIFNLKYNFSKCNNKMAFEHSQCELLLFLNNDIIFANKTSLLELYTTSKINQNIGIFGALLYFNGDLVQHAGVDFSKQPEIYGLCYHPLAHRHIPANAFPAIIDAPATTGAFLAIRASLFSAVAGFDDAYVAECQDVALCLAIHRYGYKIVTLNLGQTIHLENATRQKNEEHWPDRQRFLRKWGSYIHSHFLS